MNVDEVLNGAAKNLRADLSGTVVPELPQPGRRRIPVVAIVFIAIGLAAVAAVAAMGGDHATQVATEVTTTSASPDLDQQTADSRFLGLSEEDAVALGESEGLTVRVASRDGEPQELDLDIQSNRINLSIEEGVVTRVERY